jgi:hypothetical protein
MIFTPNDLREFLAVCKAQIPVINYVKPVIDDSQMSNDVNQVKKSDNLLLYGVLPDYGGDSGEEDGLMMDNGLDFLVLKKVQYSDITHDDFIDVMQETLMAARELVKLVYAEKNKPNTCSKFYFVKEGKEQITPVWAKAGCNGYMVSFNLRTEL